MKRNLDKPIIFIVSDSLGETAELVVKAAASQFNGTSFEINRISYVDEPSMIVEVVKEACVKRGIIVYTLIVPQLRQILDEEANRLGVPHADIMGPVLDAMEKVSSHRPKLQPGLVHKLDEVYFKRVEALEFAVKSDDGKNPDNLFEADIVLIGVSRTSKTPVSLYLAERGFKVANVPIVPGISPPEQVFKIPHHKVVGLTISASHLYKIRQERLKSLGLSENSPYADMERIYEEIAHARKIFKEIGCYIVDVSTKAVEETANKVIQLIRTS